MIRFEKSLYGNESRVCVCLVLFPAVRELCLYELRWQMCVHKCVLVENQIHLEVSFLPPPYFCLRLCFEQAAALSSKRDAIVCVCVCVRWGFNYL